MNSTKIGAQITIDNDFVIDDSVYIFPGIGINDPVSPRTFAIDVNDQPVECKPESIGHDVSWRTLISSDRQPSSDFVLGIGEIRSGGVLPAHRHIPAEFYLGLSGDGVVIVEGIEHLISAGISIFIPGNFEHSIVAGDVGLSFAYGFARDSFSDITYELSSNDRKHG